MNIVGLAVILITTPATDRGRNSGIAQIPVQHDVVPLSTEATTRAVCCLRAWTGIQQVRLELARATLSFLPGYIRFQQC